MKVVEMEVPYDGKEFCLDIKAPGIFFGVREKENCRPYMLFASSADGQPKKRKFVILRQGAEFSDEDGLLYRGTFSPLSGGDRHIMEVVVQAAPVAPEPAVVVEGVAGE